MKLLREQEVDELRATPPGEKLRQALDLMQTGIDLKVAALRARHPRASEADIDTLLDEWLRGEDKP